jgi:hypothetical protein
MYDKKSNDALKNSRRNPCRYLVERVVKDEFKRYENYGFVEERDMKNQMYYISTGTGGEEMWRPMDEVTLIKGRWVNKKRNW